MYDHRRSCLGNQQVQPKSKGRFSAPTLKYKKQLRVIIYLFLKRDSQSSAYLPRACST